MEYKWKILDNVPEVFLRKSGLELRNAQSITTLPTWSLEIRKEQESQVSRLTKVGWALLTGTGLAAAAPGYSGQWVRQNERRGTQQGDSWLSVPRNPSSAHSRISHTTAEGTVNW